MKQIEINYLTSTGYESLYPNVNCASITDFAENLYSKSEVDEMVQELRNQTGDLKFAMGSYVGTHDASSLNPAEDTIMAGPWNIIVTNFSVEVLMLFDISASTSQVAEITRKLPFYVTQYGSPNTNVIEARDNGFAVRNVARNHGGVGVFRERYNQLNLIYNYLAFG